MYLDWSYYGNDWLGKIHKKAKWSTEIGFTVYVNAVATAASVSGRKSLVYGFDYRPSQKGKFYSFTKHRPGRREGAPLYVYSAITFIISRGLSYLRGLSDEMTDETPLIGRVLNQIL